MPLLHIYAMKDHAVIYGLGEYGWPMVQMLVIHGIPVTVIEPDTHNVHFAWANNNGVDIVTGSIRDINNLSKANVMEAKYLLALTENDATNVEIIREAFQLKSNNPGSSPLNCIAHIAGQESASAVYDVSLFSKDHDCFSAHGINTNQMAARWLLANHGPDTEITRVIPNPDDLGVLLFGSNKFVEYFILRLAKLGHYGNSQPLKIILAGPQATSQLTVLRKRFPALSAIVNITGRDIEPAFLHTNSSQQLIDDFNPSTVYVCAADAKLTPIWSKALAQLEIDCPIIMCQWPADFLPEIVEEEFSFQTHVKFVHLTKEVFDFNQIFNAIHDQLAIAIHNHYVETQIIAGETGRTNASLVRWEDLPETLKDANRSQADHLQIKCRTITGSMDYTALSVAQHLDDANIERLSRMEHERWTAEKLLDGWRYTGGIKNTEARLSPNLISWEELPEFEREKDRDSVRNIPRLLQWIESRRTSLT